MSSIKTLSLSSFSLEEVNFKYINEERGWLDSFELSGVDSLVIDDSTVSLLLDHTITNNSLHINYDELPYMNCLSSDCGESDNEVIDKYIFTSPISKEDVCRLLNIIPLKNGYTEDNKLSCNRDYRDYKCLYMDGDKPCLTYNSGFSVIDITDEEFILELPEGLSSLSINDTINCFNGNCGDCPTNADSIHWLSGDIEICSWLSGNECEKMWYDRYYGIIGDDICDRGELNSVMFTDVPSELVLESGGMYIYKKGGSTNNESSLNEDSLIFDFDCVSGVDVFDLSENQIQPSIKT